MPVYYFFYNFLLISIMNFHISLSRSVDPPVHLLFRGDIHIIVLSKNSVWWYSTTIVPCHFENSQCHHGRSSVQSSLRLWNHGVLSVLITHYRISDIVRSSAEVKRLESPCLAPCTLIGRPASASVGFRSSTHHVEMRRMLGYMYIVAMSKQN